MISQLITVKPDCDRTVIPKINFHVSAENPAGNGKPIASKSILETLKEGFRNFWWRGVCKAGAAAPVRIGIKSELRDNENFSADIKEGTVHLALIVAKNAQIDNFIYQHLYLYFAIVQPYSQKYQESLAYLADSLFINHDTGIAYSL